MEKVALEVLGLTSGHSQKSSYTLILGESGGSIKLPIVIGAFEAQAIALYMEKIKPQRPLTHDLFTSFAQSFGVQVREVYINDLVEGIFYSRLICFADGDTIEIDARTSDAVALALRFGCPIYTRRDILHKAGIQVDEEIPENPEHAEEDYMLQVGRGEDYSELSMDELRELLEEAIQVEDYDRAAQIRDEINRRS